MPRRELELLAPARDADIGIEAVNHGADAIYIGGPGFGARDKASNSVADIERLARHAHRYGARIFVTVNTILRDDEVDPARRLIHQLHGAGADALIVQDMALLDMAAAGELPPIQLHASTQTDIRTPEKARFLQDVGIRQMVLARELTLAQIGAIEAALRAGAPEGDSSPPAVLEFFIHGALCVAYSGQCYISHAINGRSANRGSCSQECRQPYTVLDGANRIVAHEKHVLSLKDNNQSDNLEALVDAGIRAFKIEGRYKDMATVKNVTAHYRQLVDALLERRPEFKASSDGRCRYTFSPTPTAPSTAAPPTTSSTAAVLRRSATSAPSTRPSMPACRWAKCCAWARTTSTSRPATRPPSCTTAMRSHGPTCRANCKACR
jgi:putative protease